MLSQEKERIMYVASYSRKRHKRSHFTRFAQNLRIRCFSRERIYRKLPEIHNGGTTKSTGESQKRIV